MKKKEKTTSSTFLTVPSTFCVNEPVNLITANANTFKPKPSDAAGKAATCQEYFWLFQARLHSISSFIVSVDTNQLNDVSTWRARHCAPAAKYHRGWSRTRCHARCSTNRRHSSHQMPTQRKATHADDMSRNTSNVCSDILHMSTCARHSRSASHISDENCTMSPIADTLPVPACACCTLKMTTAARALWLFAFDARLHAQA